MYDKVLVPKTRSQKEDKVVKHAVEHAIKHDAEIHVVHVLPQEIAEKIDKSTRPAESSGSPEPDRAIEEAKSLIPDEVEVVTTQLNGSPSTAITRYASENGIDLIVMGTHGRSGVKRYLLGSVAEEVVRNSDVPVLTLQLE